MKRILTLIDNRGYLTDKSPELLDAKGASIEAVVSSLCAKQTTKNPNFVLQVFMLSFDDHLVEQIESQEFKFSENQSAAKEVSAYLESRPVGDRPSYIYSRNAPVIPQDLPVFHEALCQSLRSEIVGEQMPYIAVFVHNREPVDPADASGALKPACVHMQLLRYQCHGRVDAEVLKTANKVLGPNLSLEESLELLNISYNSEEAVAAAGIVTDISDS